MTNTTTTNRNTTTGDNDMSNANRYDVVRDVVEVPCDHPMCEQFHQRFMEYGLDGRTRFHNIKRRQWLVWDNTTDQRAFDGDVYDTKRDAVAALARNVAAEARRRDAAPVTNADRLKAAIRSEYGCEPTECDTASAIDLAIDLGIINESDVDTDPDGVVMYVRSMTGCAL